MMKRYLVLKPHEWDGVDREAGDLVPGPVYDKSPARRALIDDGTIEVDRATAPDPVDALDDDPVEPPEDDGF